MIYVFDLDGTLIDSTYRHGYLMEKLLLLENVKIEERFKEKFLELKGNGRNSKDALREGFNINEEIVDTVVKAWIASIEKDELLYLDKLYNDSVEVLEWVKENDFKTYFLTLRQRKDALIDELKRLELLKYADDIFVGSVFDGIQYKKAELEKLSMIDKVVMIGDTEVDYEAAIKSKTDYFLMDYGFRSKEFWNRYGLQNTYSSLKVIMS